MSGAEAAAAFGLAAGIMQVIGFSLQLWDTTENIRKTGSTITTADCMRKAELLKKQCDEVNALQSVKTRLEESARINEIANESCIIAQDIASRLATCKVPEGSKGYTWFKDVIVNVLWNGQRTDVESLKKRLEGLQHELQFQIVVSIKKRVDLQDLQRTTEYEKLGQSLQKMVQALLEGEDSVGSQLKTQTQLLQYQNDEIHQMQQDVRGLLLQGKRPHMVPKDQRHVLEELRNRLWFNAMSHRHDSISEAHAKTFEWVFTGEQVIGSSNQTFVEWMRSQQGFYWVSGRAGTGKSSLMRFLNDDPRTKSAFEEWAGDRPLIIGSFYFWNNPDKSTDSRLSHIDGIYQSVLYQIIKVAPELAESLFPEHIGGRDWGSFPTSLDLKQAFARLLRSDTLPVAIALMIDGLDEYDATSGDQIDLANMLKDASTKPHLKVLVSSRPEFAFEVAFEDCARLKLDQLTEVDRRVFVTDSLKSNRRFYTIGASADDQESLIAQVVERSEGIFLWVRVVVMALQEELYIARNIKTLTNLVDATPSGAQDLSNLFNHIFRTRIKPDRRPRAFRMIWALQECHTLTKILHRWMERLGAPSHMATCLLYSFFDEDLTMVKTRPMTDSERKKRLDRATLDLQRNCVGLLEVRRKAWYNVDLDVHFLHKDVSLFLKEQESKKLLDEVLHPQKSMLLMQLLESFVMVTKTYGEKDVKRCGREGQANTPDVKVFPFHLAEVVMRLAGRTIEADFGKTEYALDELDKAMAQHFSTWLVIPAELHWANYFPYDAYDPNIQFHLWAIIHDVCGLDFLNLAIQYGLCQYVQTKLEKDRKLLFRKGPPLLSSACAPVLQYWVPEAATIRLECVEMLLTLGADPNQEFRGYTPWQMALLLAHDSGFFDSKELEKLAKVFRLLLQHGADPYTNSNWTGRASNFDGREGYSDFTKTSIEEQIQMSFNNRPSKEVTDDGCIFYLAGWKWGVAIPARVSEDARFIEIGNELLALLQQKRREKEPQVQKSTAKADLAKRVWKWKAKSGVGRFWGIGTR